MHEIIGDGKKLWNSREFLHTGTKNKSKLHISRCTYYNIKKLRILIISDQIKNNSWPVSHPWLVKMVVQIRKETPNFVIE